MNAKAKQRLSERQAGNSVVMDSIGVSAGSDGPSRPLRIELKDSTTGKTSVLSRSDYEAYTRSQRPLTEEKSEKKEMKKETREEEDDDDDNVSFVRRKPLRSALPVSAPPVECVPTKCVPTTMAARTRYSWYQTSDTVGVDLFAKDTCPEDVRVDIQPRAVSLSLSLSLSFRATQT